MSLYTDRLNDVQDATLEAISLIRDEINIILANCYISEVNNTIKQMLSYMSQRSQAVSFLISAGYVWDAEIILRSLYETNARIWLICLAPSEKDRETLVAEFWSGHAELHNRKRAGRADAAAAIARSNNAKSDYLILSALADDQLFEFSKAGKAARKKIEQKWSFTEIVKFLEKNSPRDFDMGAIGGTLHMYGLSSHLIHADAAALDLMVDRKLRSADELAVLTAAHLCRIFSDQASFWLFSAMTLAHRFERKTAIRSEVFEKYARIQKLSKPISDEFEQSQAAFYEKSEGWSPSQ